MKTVKGYPNILGQEHSEVPDKELERFATRFLQGADIISKILETWNEYRGTWLKQGVVAVHLARTKNLDENMFKEFPEALDLVDALLTAFERYEYYSINLLRKLARSGKLKELQREIDLALELIFKEGISALSSDAKSIKSELEQINIYVQYFNADQNLRLTRSMESLTRSMESTSKLAIGLSAVTIALVAVSIVITLVT